MQIYQIYIPELHANVKFKVLPATDVEEFAKKHKRLSTENYKKKVLQHFIYNLNVEVSQSLSMMSRISAERALESIFAGCIMLNPGLDIDQWIDLSYALTPVIPFDQDSEDNIEEIKKFIRSKGKPADKAKVAKPKKMTKQKFLGIQQYLEESVIGQSEAVEEIVSALLRSQADLNDGNRPLGVFLFAGSSGVGKTHLANKLHEYMYSSDLPMVRIDCGELQHKHENQKLLGSPPGYVGHDEGGQLTNQIKRNPNTVVLIDEVEKAHQDIWNTFLRIFDEGVVTDAKGELVDFRNCIIIMTTNLGNEKVVNDLVDTGVGFNQSVDFSRRTSNTPKRDVVIKNADKAIHKYFRPELLNRIDKVVVFNHLSKEDCIKIAKLEMSVTANKLSKKGISLDYTDNVIDGLIDLGIDTVKGARGLAQIRRDNIETEIARTIVESQVPKGTIFHVDYVNKEFSFNIQKPIRKSKAVKSE